jgi:hypothetical protein
MRRCSELTAAAAAVFRAANTPFAEVVEGGGSLLYQRMGHDYGKDGRNNGA